MVLYACPTLLGTVATFELLIIMERLDFRGHRHVNRFWGGVD